MTEQHVERVTELKPVAKPTREKDPKRVAAGRAGAAARKANQAKLQKELMAAKEAMRCDTDTVNIAAANTVPARTVKQQESASTDWTPWIIAAAAAGVVMFQCMQPPVGQKQQKTAQGQVSVVESTPKPEVLQLDNTTCAKQLKVAANPFYME